MRFRKYLWLEVKRLLGRRYLAIVLIFFLAAGYFVQYGISQYKHTLDERNNFQQFEKEKYQHFVYPSYYGNYGFRLLFIPSSFIAFFNGGPVPAFLTAYIDGSERMKIYQPLKGQNVFSRIIVLIGTNGLIIPSGSMLMIFLYMLILSPPSGAILTARCVLDRILTEKTGMTWILIYIRKV